MPMPKIMKKIRELENAGKKEEAKALLLSEADSGDADAQGILGNQYFMGNSLFEKDYEKAFWYSEKAAENGNAMGKHTLGILYLYGYGVPADTKRAVQLLREASDSGEMKSPRYLGLCYLDGLDGSVDYEKALEWFRKGAELGDITSQYYLGKMYEEGLGTESSLKTAVYWYRKAAVRKDHVGKPANDALARLGVEA
ncbi:MAG: sel1 repeat family protein [Ruminococcus sp.]|nr:sel1 repeat family protein [Ruminococcus sp.]